MPGELRLQVRRGWEGLSSHVRLQGASVWKAAQACPRAEGVQGVEPSQGTALVCLALLRQDPKQPSHQPHQPQLPRE